MVETRIRPSAPDGAVYGREAPASAQLLSLHDPVHRLQGLAEMKRGNPIAFGFHGIYALGADAYNAEAARRIMEIKNRPQDKGLVLVADPYDLHEIADFSRFPYTHDQIIALQTGVHAVGVILPASDNAPRHLVTGDGPGTILNIWTEYPPLREFLDAFRRDGGRALTATSANKSGQGTHYDALALYEEFKYDLPVVLGDDYAHLPEIRRKSTSVIRFDGEIPILHREGNVTAEELNEALVQNGFSELTIPEDHKVVTGRS